MSHVPALHQCVCVRACACVCACLELHSLLYDGVGHTEDVTEGQSLQGGPFREAQQPEHVQPVVLRQVLPSHVLQNWHQVLVEKKGRDSNKIEQLYLFRTQGQCALWHLRSFLYTRHTVLLPTEPEPQLK